MNPSRRGFTLIELLVVIVLIGVLAAFGVPQYLRVMENSKAENTASIVNMMGTANRMYALDHNGLYISGTISNNNCNPPPPAVPCQGNGTLCDIIACKYVAAMDWNGMPYQYSLGATCGAGMSACATRKPGASPGTNNAPYSTWGYRVSIDGVITPLPCSGSPACPPSPSQ